MRAGVQGITPRALVLGLVLIPLMCFWTAEHIRGWLAPICVWSTYLVVMIWVMLCLNVLLRKQWMDRERLSFPIVQLPLELTKEGGAASTLLSRQMWLGFMIPVVLES